MVVPGGHPWRRSPRCDQGGGLSHETIARSDRSQASLALSVVATMHRVQARVPMGTTLEGLVAGTALANRVAPGIRLPRVRHHPAGRDAIAGKEVEALPAGPRFASAATANASRGKSSMKRVEHLEQLPWADLAPAERFHLICAGRGPAQRDQPGQILGYPIRIVAPAPEAIRRIKFGLYATLS